MKLRFICTIFVLMLIVSCTEHNNPLPIAVLASEQVKRPIHVENLRPVASFSDDFWNCFTSSFLKTIWWYRIVGSTDTTIAQVKISDSGYSYIHLRPNLLERLPPNLDEKQFALRGQPGEFLSVGYTLVDDSDGKTKIAEPEDKWHSHSITVDIEYDRFLQIVGSSRKGLLLVIKTELLFPTDSPVN